MNIKRRWIISVATDVAVAAVAAPIYDILHYLFTQYKASPVVELRIKWNEPEAMYADRQKNSTTNIETLLTIDKFIWRVKICLVFVFRRFSIYQRKISI